MNCDIGKDTPQGQMSLMEFSAGLLEFVMVAAETTDIKAGSLMLGSYQIKVAGKTFSGKLQDEVYTKFLQWLLTKDKTIPDTVIAKAIEDVEEKERREAAAWIDELAEGGMTEHGKQLQTLRELLEKGSPVI